MDNMMTDKSVTSVTALDLATDTSTNDFSATGSLDLTGYLRETTTTYFYCWDSTGLITAQDEAATADCTRSN